MPTACDVTGRFGHSRPYILRNPAGQIIPTPSPHSIPGILIDVLSRHDDAGRKAIRLEHIKEALGGDMALRREGVKPLMGNSKCGQRARQKASTEDPDCVGQRRFKGEFLATDRSNPTPTKQASLPRNFACSLLPALRNNYTLDLERMK